MENFSSTRTVNQHCRLGIHRKGKFFMTCALLELLTTFNNYDIKTQDMVIPLSQYVCWLLTNLQVEVFNDDLILAFLISSKPDMLLIKY